ncbi:type II secretion system F family protein [Candidatus Falkowbacteria bacterium]|nr:type II secretion system F family protein [Candidatus Falkowbacteria bacterium]
MANPLKRLNQWFSMIQGVPLSQKIFFVQNLQVMIKAGLPLAQALNALTAQSTNAKLKRITLDAYQQIEAGQTLSTVLAKYPRVFPKVFIAMIRAAEVSGNLENILGQLVIQMKKDYELISKVKGAMTYPVVVLIAMIGIGIGMMIFVIPKITSIFTEMAAQLPLPTRLLIGLSNFVNYHGIITGAIVIILTAAVVIFIRHPRGQYLFHRLLLHSPVIGPIIKKINLARFARTLNSLIKTDIPIVQSFQITAHVVGNLIYREIITATGRELKTGSTINAPLSQHADLFPPVVTQMIQVGEQSGNLEELFDELATFYENDVHETMNNLSSIIEPVLIVILGIAVAAMAIAIIMPMYSLTSQI